MQREAAGPRARPGAAPDLAETERWAAEYADMQKQNPGGVIA